MQGNSYAIPTKGLKISYMPLPEVNSYVNQFIEFAKKYPEFKFQVTRIGCGLAGFHDSEIAPMFRDAPMNCYFDNKWKAFLGNNFKYWGTY